MQYLRFLSNSRKKKKGGDQENGWDFLGCKQVHQILINYYNSVIFLFALQLGDRLVHCDFSSSLVEYAKSKQNWFAKTSHQSHNFCSLFYMKEAQKSGKKVLKQKSLIYYRLALFILQRLWLKWGFFLLRNTLLVWIYLEMNFVVNRI